MWVNAESCHQVSGASTGRYVTKAIEVVAGRRTNDRHPLKFFEIGAQRLQPFVKVAVRQYKRV